jgi:hypothetical protein
MHKWSHGVIGLAATLLAGSSLAQNATYDVRYPISSSTPDINGTMGSNTARPAMGALRMSIRSFSTNPIPEEVPFLIECQAKSTANYWPESCNPDGMVRAFNDGDFGNWLVRRYDGSEANKTTALSAMVDAIKNHKTPIATPIYGQADHWAMVHKIMAKTATNEIVFVYLRDGGAAMPFDPSTGEGADSDWNMYDDGQRLIGGGQWRDVFVKVINSIGPADFYYNKLVFLWDPPVGTQSLNPPHYRGFAAPSPVSRGERLTPATVQRVAHEALRLGRLSDDKDLWDIFERASPALPHEVQGVRVDGRDWNYYLVPFVNNRGLLVGMALLDGQDASFQEAWLPTEPQFFAALGREEARAQAYSRASLRANEQLDEGVLTWDPSTAGGLSRSPMKPYYEFRVTGRNGEARGSVVVRLDTGVTEARGPCQDSRRLRSSTCAQ